MRHTTGQIFNSLLMNITRRLFDGITICGIFISGLGLIGLGLIGIGLIGIGLIGLGLIGFGLMGVGLMGLELIIIFIFFPSMIRTAYDIKWRGCLRSAKRVTAPPDRPPNYR